MAELLLGIDVGTYTSKGVLVNPEGKVIRSQVVEHEMSIPYPGWAEQDADEVWWGDIIKICQGLLDGHPYTGDDIRGVAVSAIGPCMLPLDYAGRPLRPGILYGVDTRASEEIAILNRVLNEDTIFDFSGMTLSSQAIGPKILWMKRHEPELWKRVDHITTASSYLIYRLTGEKVIDRHTASHFMPLIDIHSLEWSERFADQVVDLKVLPKLAWSDEIAGEVHKDGAVTTGLKVGTPVAVGAVDALSEAISVGAVNPGDLMIMYGSTTFFILVTPLPRPDRKIWTLAGAFRGQYNLAAGMATSGTLTRWFRDELAPDLPKENAYDMLFSKAAQVEPGSGGLILLPYFSGERTPINDPKAKGIIAGLTLAHSRSHLFRAVLEGVGYGIRHNIETFQSNGADVCRILAVGGGTKSPIWLQIVSDITGFPQYSSSSIGASYGDAFLAGVATGLISRDDLTHWITLGKVIQPDHRLQDLYDHNYALYRSLYLQTKDIMHDLS